jgi:efflux transporter, outer membrane factor (OMF) lipoprotein, NodT family
MRNRAHILIGVALLGGCNMAPKYVQPVPPVPASFPGAPSSGGESAAAVGWQRFFGDPQLKAYIAAALANNRDLAAAAARIEQAKAQFRIRQAEQLPQVDGSANGTRTRAPLGSLGLGDSLGSGSITYNQYSVRVATSAFELDFWGRVRNLSESARRSYLATVEAQRAFRLSLIGDVAATYYSIRAGEEGIALAERTLASRRQGLGIAKLRLDAGVTSSVDYDQSVALLTQAQTELADLRRTTEQQRNQLLVLIGGPMTAPLPAGRPIGDAGQFAALDTGIPSALLQIRPDILQAEQQLQAANADIGAARAAFFPTISLTGAFGFASPQLQGLFDGNNQNWSFGGSAALPIFDWGKRERQLEATKARRDELAASYQRTVQNAFREVSDALVGQQRYREQIEAQEQAVAAQRRLAETATLRYNNGIAIYLEVLDAERNLFLAEQQLIRLRATELQNGVSLYTALGGGSDG